MGLGRKNTRANSRNKSNRRSASSRPARKSSKPSRQPKVAKANLLAKIRKAKIKDSVMFDVPHYPQTEEFTSSAACAMMVLKYINPEFKLKRESEFDIWQEAVNGSVWHGSRYGLAYALSKRGAKAGIVTNAKDEGYEKKLAVYENVNLDTLSASFNEIRLKSQNANVTEEIGTVTLQSIKKTLSSKNIPIVLIDAKVINPYLESSPHWVVVKGYDKDTFYINDPYSDSTITIDADAFKAALGYDSDFHMILVDSKAFNKK
ncbi:MAG: peptidase C39 family protein [Candidatus Micrarchaeota archaeon]|nr:peptidase C39 family protein [Candidatus Micrarchaeota archaeon]